MNYLQTLRARIALLLFLLSSLFLTLLPDVDLAASSLFCRADGFPLKAALWTLFLQGSVNVLVIAAPAAVLGLYVFNRVQRRTAGGVDTRVVCYLFTVLLLGAVLIVNVGLKGNFGRARPRNVTQFGGAQSFTPAFVVAQECTRNCSFSSGDVAGAGFSMALALAFSRRRAVLALAMAFVGLVAFSRIAAGAHFLSDTVVSFFVMWILADALHFHWLLPPAERRRALEAGADRAP